MTHHEPKGFTVRLKEVGRGDVWLVGSKNAALGEMLQQLEPTGVRVPEGFAVTSEAYWELLRRNELIEEIKAAIEDFQGGRRTLEDTGQRIREGILQATIPEDIEEALTRAYRELSSLYNTHEVGVAVRSSATAEDLPGASFAGLYDSRLNVTGKRELLEACRQCIASLFTDRAIRYRHEKQLDQLGIAQCIGVQKMVRADLAGAGVLFTKDQDFDFDRLMVLTAAWGLGENVVQGCVNPDVILLFKPFLDRTSSSPILEALLGLKEKTAVLDESGQGTVHVETERSKRRSFVLSRKEAVLLGRWGAAIEELFGLPMDIEWAKDGQTDELYVVQARPIAEASGDDRKAIELLRLTEPGQRLLSGTSIGQGVVQGTICLLSDAGDIHTVSGCPILVSETANTAWLPDMQKQGVQGLITDFGGKNSHAATLSRELGIPAVLGTVSATERLTQGQEVTLFAVQGDFGHVYAGRPAYERQSVSFEDIPETQCGFWLQVETPESMLRWWRMPSKGVGLVSLEFLLRQWITIHPLALLYPERISSRAIRMQIETVTAAYPRPADYFPGLLRTCVAKIAAAAYPRPVVVRLNDLGTEGFSELKGGDVFEAELPRECRGTARYLHPGYREAFGLELDALRSVREEMGFDNVELMIPHCPRVQEADRLLGALQEHGLAGASGGARLHLSLDYEANLDDLEAFSERFSGWSLDSDALQAFAAAKAGRNGHAGTAKEGLERQAGCFGSILQACERGGLSLDFRADKAERIEAILPYLIKAGLTRITLPPEEVLPAKQWVRDAEAGG